MMISLCLGVAPALTTTLFAFSIETQIARGNLAWIVFFAFTTIAALYTLAVKRPTRNWRSAKAALDD